MFDREETILKLRARNMPIPFCGKMVRGTRCSSSLAVIARELAIVGRGKCAGYLMGAEKTTVALGNWVNGPWDFDADSLAAQLDPVTVFCRVRRPAWGHRGTLV